MWSTLYYYIQCVKIFIAVIATERPMEVEEGEILSFNFINFTRNPHFLYVLCLEETGGHKMALKQ